MALSANTVWEVRASGAFNNGGGFVTGASGTDFSQQDAAQFALTGLTTAGVSASVNTASAAASMVGNIAHVISGTNATAGFYEIISVVVGVSITFDRNWCTGAVANGVINIGGAINFNSASITQLTSAAVAGNTIWVKSGSHTMGNNLTFTNGSGTARIRIMGYNATRGDAPRNANRPSVNCQSNAIQPGNNNYLAHIDFTGTGSRNITGATATQIFNCKSVNSGSFRSILLVDNMTVIDCEVSCPSAVGIEFQNGHAYIWGCYIHDCTTGILCNNTTPQAAIQNCLFARNTTAINCSASFTGVGTFIQNTFYGTAGVSGTGISFASGSTGCFVVLNNIFKNLTTAITHGSASNVIGHSDWNQFHGNTTDRTNWPTGANDITTDPGFRDAANSDFRVGANSKAAALSASSSCSTSPGYMEPGNVQRLEDYPAASLVVSGTVYSNTETTGTYALTTTDIAAAVWDRTLTGATHNIANSAGRRLRNISGAPETAGAVNDVSATTTSFVSNLTSSLDDLYKHHTLVFEDGTLAGVARPILSYNGTTKVITFEEALPSAPANGVLFTIKSDYEITASEIASAVWEEATSGHTTSGSFGAWVQKLLTFVQFLGLK